MRFFKGVSGGEGRRGRGKRGMAGLECQKRKGVETGSVFSDHDDLTS